MYLTIKRLERDWNLCTETQVGMTLSVYCTSTVPKHMYSS